MPNLSVRRSQMSEVLATGTSDAIIRFIMDWLVDLTDEFDTENALLTEATAQITTVTDSVTSLTTTITQLFNTLSTRLGAEAAARKALADALAVAIVEIHQDHATIATLSNEVAGVQAGLEAIPDLEVRLGKIETIIATLGNPEASTHAALKLTQGDLPAMPASITVDDTNKKITLSWLDDKGDTDAAAPAGAVATATVDNPTVLPLTPDPANAFAWDIAGQTEGTATVTVSLLGAGGSNLTEADGTTPFPPVPPVSVTVTAGGAVSASAAEG